MEEAVKIVTLVRTRNETKNIDRFCQGYNWTDAILVADGGSTDDTVEKARAHSNVQVRSFKERVERNGVWRNPEGRHINFLLEWAEGEKADWVLMDDCDSTPNTIMRNNARGIIETCRADSVWMYRVYLYGTDKWFPQLTGYTIPPEPEHDWHGLWGWQPKPWIRWRELDGWIFAPIEGIFNEWQGQPRQLSRCLIDYPNCLLHYFCLDEEETQRKFDFYRESTGSKGMKHPSECNGPLEDLPEWAHP